MKKIFTFLIIILCFSVINVYAEPTTWPNTFTHEDYEYKIEGISLRVYKLEKNSDGELTEESNNNYINDIPTKEIALPASSYTINPEYKTTKITGTDTILIDLNLNITGEQLKTLLAEELSNTTETKYYIAEFAVNYKLTQYPQKYKHIYNTNFIRSLTKILSNETPEEQDMTKTINQVFNAALVDYDKDTNSSKITYENTITSENGIGNYVLNYLSLYENEYSLNTSASKLLMFYNIDNIDYLIENLNNVEYNFDENPKTSVTDEEINVPNTAKSVSNYIYIISISSIILGLLVIGYTINKRKKIG